MKYLDAIKEAEANNLHIEPHVIPLGMAWRVAGYTNVEVVRDINWSAVSEQTDLKLADDIYWLEAQPADKQLEYLVKELGYKGVLLIVTSTKQIDNSGRCRYSEGYDYLPNPDWNDVGIAVGLLVERVIASWQEAS